jgi:hypothetical protein
MDTREGRCRSRLYTQVVNHRDLALVTAIVAF